MVQEGVVSKSGKPNPKSKPTGSAGKGQSQSAKNASNKKKASANQKTKKDTTLRAIILANSFSKDFLPISEHTPICLFPLLNKPILLLQLHQLRDANFQEVIIYCSSHIDKIKAAIQEEGFPIITEPHSLMDDSNTSRSITGTNITPLTFQVRLVSNNSAASVGDALRDLADQQLILSDFVLLFGDIISNVPFHHFMNYHRSTSATMSHILLSLVYQIPPLGNGILGQKLHSWHDCDLQLVTNPTKCNEVRHLHYSPEGIEVPHQLLCNHETPSRLISNAMDTGIVLCEPYAATLFQDNYDYSNIEDVVEGVLSNPDILDCTIHAIASYPNDFIYRIRHLGLYNLLSKLCISHKVSRLSPEDRVFRLSSQSVNSLSIADSDTAVAVYYPQGSAPPRSIAESVIHRGTVIYGKDCSVGKGCVLENVVLGNGCHLGDNVHMVNVIAWDNVKLESDSRVESGTLLCSNVQIGRGSVVRNNCVLDRGCVVDANAEIPANTVLSLNPSGQTVLYSEDGSSFPVEGRDASQLGQLSILHYIQRENGDGVNTKTMRLRDSNIGRKRPSVADSNRGQSESDSELENASIRSETEEEEEDNEGLEEDRQFVGELQQTWTRPVDTQNIVLEVNALKHAYNIEIDTLYMLLGRSLVDQSYRTLNTSSNATFAPLDFKKQLESLCAQVKRVIQHYITAKNVETQINFLQGVEEYIVNNPLLMSSANAVNYIIHILYNEDIVSDSVILRWRDASPLLRDEELLPRLNELRENLKPLFTWLEEDDEEESD